MIFQDPRTFIGDDSIRKLGWEKPLELLYMLQFFDLGCYATLQFLVPCLQLFRLLDQFCNVRVNSNGATVGSLAFMNLDAAAIALLL